MAKKTALAIYMDEIAAEVHKYLKTLGYRKFGHTYNRETEPGLIQVINLQAAPNFSFIHGLFTVNLSIYIQEVKEAYSQFSSMKRRFIRESEGDFRRPLVGLIGKEYSPLLYFDPKSRWWRIEQTTEAIGSEIVLLLEKLGQPYLDQYKSREAILALWMNMEAKKPDIKRNIDAFFLHRIAAIILAKQGDLETAKRYLQEEYRVFDPMAKEGSSFLAQRLGITLDTK